MDEHSNIEFIYFVKQEAIEVLAPFLRPINDSVRAEMARQFRPQPEDYGKIFLPRYIEIVKAGYEQFWCQNLYPAPEPGQTELMVFVAPSDAFLSHNPLSNAFPGGYRKIAETLQPDRIWVRWKFVEPGETLGMAFDGLVWVDDGFVWFPKPWRVLG